MHACTGRGRRASLQAVVGVEGPGDSLMRASLRRLTAGKTHRHKRKTHCRGPESRDDTGRPQNAPASILVKTKTRERTRCDFHRGGLCLNSPGGTCLTVKGRIGSCLHCWGPPDFPGAFWAAA